MLRLVLLNSPAGSRIKQSRLLRSLSSWVSSILKDGNSATSLDSLILCLTTPNLNILLSSNLYLLLLVLLVGNTKKTLAPSFVHPPVSHECALIRPPRPFLLELEQAQLSQPLSCMSDAPMSTYLSGPRLGLLQYVLWFCCTAELRSGCSTPGVVLPHVCASEHLEVELLTYQIYLDN